MTISIPLVFNIPHVVVFIAMIPMMFIVGVGSFMAGKVVSDRDWNRDVRRRARSQLEMRWVAPAPADIIQRPSTDISLYRVRPYADRNDELLAA
jgi:hypothetical protein